MLELEKDLTQGPGPGIADVLGYPAAICLLTFSKSKLSREVLCACGQVSCLEKFDKTPAEFHSLSQGCPMDLLGDALQGDKVVQLH